MSNLQKSRKVHITYGDSKRIITYNKGEAVQELRLHFLRVFSDELSGDVAPANVKFQRYHDNFQDYEDLANDVQLEDNAKLRVIVTLKQVLHVDNLSRNSQSKIKKITVFLSVMFLYRGTEQLFISLFIFFLF